MSVNSLEKAYPFAKKLRQLAETAVAFPSIQVSFRFTCSLAYALAEGAAEVLEVPSTDLSTTVTYSDQHSVLPIIMYDNVPGGAGLVARLEDTEVLRACLGAAMRRVSGKCGCDEDASCYGCLRTYRNQFAHQYLQRGSVYHYLRKILDSL